jgi:chorismate lyase/3-hydroxybenzoate synthase
MSIPASTRVPQQKCPFRVMHVPLGQMAARLDDHALGVFAYSARASGPDDARIVPIALEPLDDAASAELWLSESAVQRGEEDGLRYAANADVLFGWTHLEESRLQAMEQVVEHAYRAIDRLLRRCGYRHLARTWNYLAQINAGEGDKERYRRFSLGRYHAIGNVPGFEAALPAATAIGTHASGLTICFVAGRDPVQQVENPRQLSAFRYPRQYGTRSPSFSRATLQQWHDRPMLFVSGTASIVGHASMHTGDARKQLDETLANIEALAEHAAGVHFAEQPGRFVAECYKVYARTREHFVAVADLVETRLRARAPTMALLGDVCREDLVVEVEALLSWRAAPAE